MTTTGPNQRGLFYYFIFKPIPYIMATKITPNIEDLIPAQLCFDSYPEKIFSGYITGEKWNGYEHALFEPDVMKQIIEFFKAIDPENWEECWGINDPKEIQNPSGLCDLGKGYCVSIVDAD